jgi:CheY-like chemotaxis protein
MNKLQEGDGNGSTRLLSEFSWSKKTVLLVDVHSRTRESRSKIMRTLGVTVHCASTASSARSRLESGLYNLILVDLGADRVGAESLVQEIKLKNPRQLVAFLVGSPLFVATSLSGKTERPSRALPPLRPIPVVNTPASKFDFGQRVKDAEADKIA